MIATVTANPCIDKTVVTENFDICRMNRVRVLRTDPSGKGINVSKAIRALGGETFCTGFSFTDGGPSPLTEDLDSAGIPHDFVPVKGNLRVCTKIFDSTRKHTIEVNEYGPPVSEADLDALLDRAAETAGKCGYLTLSGSLPAGASPDFYGRCLRRIHRDAPGCRVIADAEGELMLHALREKPFLIKPNREEFERTFGCTVGSVTELDAAVKDVMASYGVSMVCVSMGADGAYMADGEGAWFTEPYRVEIRSLQGAGDSMVAGICLALERGLPTAELLRWGAASSAASIMRDGTQVGTKEDFEALLTEDHPVLRVR